MKKEDYIILLHKQLTGVISEEENTALKEWLEIDTNRQIAEEIRTVWSASKDYNRDFTPDTQKAFAKFKSNIAETAKPPVVQMPARRKWLKIAAALVVLIAAAFLIQRLYFTAPELLTVSTGTGEKRELTLPDGSHVWLNEQSSLEYAATFSGDIRNVKLDGEAFFQVVHDEEKPFFVHSPSGYVQVLGTSFDVKDATGGDRYEVFVNSGRVAFVPREFDKKVILTTHKKAGFNKKDKKLAVETANTVNSIAWRTGVLKFNDDDLATVINDVNTYYNVHITVENPDLLNCRFTGDFEQSTIEDVVKTLAIAFDFKVKEKNKGNIRLYAGRCE